MNQETLLRESIEAMASDVRGMDGLAASAIARGRRIRRRQRIVVAASFVLLAIAGAAVFWNVSAPVPNASSADAEFPRPTRTITEPGTKIMGNWAIAAGPFGIERQQPGWPVLSTEGGEWVSPTGRYVLRPGDGGDGIQLIIMSGGIERHKIELPGGDAFQWSPVADVVLVTLSDLEGRRGFATVDAESGQVKTHLPVQIPSAFCGPCKFTWYLDGKEVVIRQAEDFTDAGGGFTARGSTYFFDALTGKPTRNLPVQVNVAGPGSWSPNGRYALSEVTEGSQLIDLEQRQMVRQFPGRAWFAGDDTVLVVRVSKERGRELLVMRLDGTVIQTFALAGRLDQGMPPVLVIQH